MQSNDVGYHLLLLVLLLLLPFSVASSGYPCPILGPNYPSPTSIATSSIIQAALSNLTIALNSLVATGNSSAGAYAANETSFSIGVFSASDNSSSPFWHYHNTAPNVANSTVGVKKVDENSVYWMGSITKLFADYSLLVEAGDEYWDQPVTKYVPELAAVAQGDASEGVEDIDRFRWEDVTVGQLGGQLAGVPRDYMQDISTQAATLGASPIQYGFPPLNPSQIPDCNYQHLCNRSEFLDYYLNQRQPVYLPGTIPVYSNEAFQLLGYAIEGITNQTVEQILNDRILGPLSMTHSRYPGSPDTSLGVIPSPFSNASWSLPTGDEAPNNGLYSTLHDMTLAGRSILSSTLLTPAQTRRWLKPKALTSSPFEAVGIPWQIHRTYISSNASFPPTRTPPASDTSFRLVDLYTKDGDDGYYSTYIILIPDYSVGINILAAASPRASATVFADLMVQYLLPALEATAREEATDAFTGVYISTTENLNSSLVFSTDDGLPGLQVAQLVSNGTNLLPLISAEIGNVPATVRAYPSNLASKGPAPESSCDLGSGAGENGTSTAMQRIAWNMLFLRDAPPDNVGVFGECDSWESVSQFAYGTKQIDQVIFELDGTGRAVAAEWPGMRVRLVRQ